MKFLTLDARIVCDHRTGIVQLRAGQGFVTIHGRPILVEHDPVGRSITGCANVGATIKPCTTTLVVTGGYSTFIRIDGRRVCLDPITGLTDGTPPVAVKYLVVDPGQRLVEEG